VIRTGFTLNGEPVVADAPAGMLLLDFLRDRGMTGTKEGCGVGVCGTCSVLVDRRAVSSCLYLVACADGADVWTVEGLAISEPELIDAFVQHEGLQCGICTPGQVVAAAALQRADRPAGDDEIVHHMAGNLCRCTGYQSILDSVKAYLARG
jgi:carbon-monoxide dehydrogenase small subunit